MTSKGTTDLEYAGIGITERGGFYRWAGAHYVAKESGIRELMQIAGQGPQSRILRAIGGGGFVADRLAGRFPRIYGWLPGVSLLLSFPVYAFAVTRNDLWSLIAAIFVSTILQFNYLGLTTGIVATRYRLCASTRK